MRQPYETLGNLYLTAPHIAPGCDYTRAYIWLGREAHQYRAERPAMVVNGTITDLRDFEAWLLERAMWKRLAAQ